MLAGGQGGAPLRRRHPHRRQPARRRGSPRHPRDPGQARRRRQRARVTIRIRCRPTRTKQQLRRRTSSRSFAQRKNWDWRASTPSSDATGPGRSKPTGSRFWKPGSRSSRCAEEHGVRIGIENCLMLFTADEWPGGKNLAVSPAVWRRMFSAIPSECFGLNYDPSHLAWMQMDPSRRCATSPSASSTSTPKTCGWTAAASTTWAFSRIHWSFTSPSCPASATSIGAGFSRF